MRTKSLSAHSSCSAPTHLVGIGIPSGRRTLRVCACEEDHPTLGTGAGGRRLLCRDAFLAGWALYVGFQIDRVSLAQGRPELEIVIFAERVGITPHGSLDKFRILRNNGKPKSCKSSSLTVKVSIPQF